LSPPPLPPLSLHAVNAALQNGTLAHRKATFSQASTHRCDSENSSILSLRLHVAYLSLTQCSLATPSRKLLLSLRKSMRFAKCILKLHTQPHSCAQYHSHSAHNRIQAHSHSTAPSHSAKLALSNTRTQPHSHSGALALRHTRTQPHSHFRIYFIVTIAALIMLVAVFLSVYFLRLSTSTQVQVSPASKQKSLY